MMPGAAREIEKPELEWASSLPWIISGR